jgi:hypothetical protein
MDDPEGIVTPKTEWRLCALCQELSEEPLQCPADSKRQDVWWVITAKINAFGIPSSRFCCSFNSL